MDTVLAAQVKVLWVADDLSPANISIAIGGRYELIPADRTIDLASQLNQAKLAIISPGKWANDALRLTHILDELDRSSAVAIFLLPEDASLATSILRQRRGQYIVSPAQAATADLSTLLEAALALQPTIADLREKNNSAPKVADNSVGVFKEIDEELRLAAQLQRDFLPQRMPEVGVLRLAALFQPAGWVSGDIYDVIRLDETHVGLYIADVAGHGLPAALMTMFIKKALPTKRIVGNSYQIIQPHVSLSELNFDICEQNLSDCKFCTAVYGIIDTSSLTFKYARAGHPLPVLIRSDGKAELLPADGSLLGIISDERYETHTCQLHAGDRLILYTDGIEGVFGLKPGWQCKELLPIFASWAKLPRHQAMLEISDRLTSTILPPHLEDDVTVLIADIGRD